MERELREISFKIYKKDGNKVYLNFDKTCKYLERELKKNNGSLIKIIWDYTNSTTDERTMTIDDEIDYTSFVEEFGGEF